FKRSADDMRVWLAATNSIFSAIEDLPFPSVTAINGIALGGGLEMCLSTAYRVMSAKAQIGVPETKLGLYPGFGGTVRLSRLIGADNAIEWITTGTPRKADAALAQGAVDAVVAPEELEAAARDLLQRAIDGEFDWQARVAEKKAPLQLNQTEAAMTFEAAKGAVLAKTRGMYPAPLEAIKRLAAGAGLDRSGALEQEAEG